MCFTVNLTTWYSLPSHAAIRTYNFILQTLRDRIMKAHVQQQRQKERNCRSCIVRLVLGIVGMFVVLLCVYELKSIQSAGPQISAIDFTEHDRPSGNIMGDKQAVKLRSNAVPSDELEQEAQRFIAEEQARNKKEMDHDKDGDALAQRERERKRAREEEKKEKARVEKLIQQRKRQEREEKARVEELKRQQELQRRKEEEEEDTKCVICKVPPDVRDYHCPAEVKRIKKLPKLPTMTVIFTICNEPKESLYYSINSVFERTPRHLLKEIVIVDDGSSVDYLQSPLEEFIRQSQHPHTQFLPTTCLVSCPFCSEQCMHNNNNRSNKKT